jgi:glycosyltransferase involved in cell wall biosynthesis
MVIISASYHRTSGFTNPADWLERIRFYTGILEELAIEHEVISIEKIDYEGLRKKNRVTYVFPGGKNKKSLIPWKMHAWIKNRKPDLILINGFIFPLQIIQLRLHLGKQVGIFILNRSERPFTGPKRSLQKLAAQCVDAFLFTSAHASREWAEAGIITDQKKVKEIVQSSSFFKKTNKSDAANDLHIKGSPVFLWVGRLEKNKDPLTVLKAFAAYLKVRPSSRLFMIYQEDQLLREVKEFIDAHTINEAVILVGKILNKDLEAWYNAADFLISGSHYEGCGIAIIEAMSCGCIPILTDILSFKKLTGDGLCGFVYKAGDKDDLFSVLCSTTSVSIHEESLKSIAQFNLHLSFKAIAEKIVKAFLETGKKPSGITLPDQVEEIIP